MFSDICCLGDSDTRGELVSLSSNGDNQAGVFRVVTQRLAQMGDVLRQVPLFYDGVAPHGLQQFLFGDQTVWVLSEKEQEVKSFRGQRNGRIRARQCAPTWIQHKLPEVVQVAHRKLVSLHAIQSFSYFFRAF